MFKNLRKVLGGDPLRRELERYAPLVSDVAAREPVLRAMSDEALQAQTAEFRRRLAAGEALEAILPEAFAVVRETSVRTIGLRHFDVQIVGGALLHEGKIVEMRTGEGKTLVATLPLYLNALSGNGAHLVTVNDYLARRDARWMGPIFRFLGMSVGVLQEAARTENGRKAFVFDPEHESAQEDAHRLRIVDRRLAYAADITYGTNNEFGFDYLRDNMAQSLDARVQRGHAYVILDEVDNILIDEARTPLIISGPSHEDAGLYERVAAVVKGLRAEDYEVSERDRTVALTELGEDHVESLLGTRLRDPDRPEDITPEQARLLGHVEQALRAEALFKRNKDYVVQGGRVIIVDEFTGRLMAGRRWSDGLHQAVEAKEGVRVREDNVTYATITLQNYFRMYGKLAGMTGTAVTEAEEFHKIYNVEVAQLPTNLEYMALQPESGLVDVEYSEDGQRFSYFSRKDDTQQRPVFWRRKDYPDMVYRTQEAKLRAVTTEILMRHTRGQPLLVGTTSVELSERLSGRLKAESLQSLAMILVLRDAYLGAKGLSDDGSRIEELQGLHKPLSEITTSDLRPLARELNLALNPARPENLERLIRLLGLEAEHQTRLAEILGSGIRHSVLNAKRHAEESAIIAGAGALGAVTIATNMAGRGVDIKLGGEIAEEVMGAAHRILRRAGVAEPELMTIEERAAGLRAADRSAIGIYGAEVDLFLRFVEEEKRVRDIGGLHVVGSERHEARRIDNQLRGRAARQGDPGSSQFFLSLEDELMRLFGGSQVSGLMERLNIDDATPIAHGIVSRVIEQAQSRVEGANFDTRKHLLEYDDVLNQQREVFYGQRNRIFTKEDLRPDVEEMIAQEVERRVTGLDEPEGRWKLLAWLEEMQPTLNLESPRPYPSYLLRLLMDSLEDTDAAGRRRALLDVATEALEAQHAHLSKAIDEQLERSVTRLEDQVRQRVEMAETAIEGALTEAEETGSEVDPAALLRSVEEAAGVRIQLGDNGARQIRSDPAGFQKMVPQVVEAGLAVRIWAGLLQAVEGRLGESLGLPASLPTPVDWDAAERQLVEAYERVWKARAEAILSEIGRELEVALPDGAAPTEALTARLLVQMSYGQRVLFDRRTHQRRAVLVARLSYPYFAARLLEDVDPAELKDEVDEHVQGALAEVEQSLGRGELTRMGATPWTELDERLQRGMRRILGQEAWEEVVAAGGLEAQPADRRPQIERALGQAVFSEGVRGLILAVGDRLWVDYLTQMEALRTSIGLEAYGQRDPLVQYKSRAFDMFGHLQADIRSGVVSRLFRTQTTTRQPLAAASAGEVGPAAPAPSAPVESSEESPRKKRRRRH
jgi:preprotein translocase subunit SecA